MRIKTNDPARPWFDVAVTGQVEAFAIIRPERVVFSGKAGEPLSLEIEIVPREEYPFTITGIKARKGEFISFEQKERCGDGKDRCVIRVENTRAEKGSYMDALFIHTDSETKPNFPVYITGIIR